MSALSLFSLPTSLDVNGATYPIDSDYRAVLTALVAYDDPDLTESEKMELLLDNIYLDFRQIPPQDIAEAYKAAVAFIDHGQEPDGKSARSMDWEQDAPLLFPAVNRVAGFEVRSADYIHWWTFIGFFMEIRDSVFSSVLSLRQKRNRGKKLEKHEQEFWRENRKICELRKRKTREQIEEEARLNAVVDNWFSKG